MAIKQTSFFKPAVATATDPYVDAQRQRAMAEALLASSAKPRNFGTATTGQATIMGLTQLAEALLARRAGNKATQAENAASAKMTSVNDALANQLRPQNTVLDSVDETPPEELQSRYQSPSGQQMGAQAWDVKQALAGQDPRVANQLLTQQALGQMFPDPAAAEDRALKRLQIQGGLDEQKAAREQRIQELQMRIEDARQRGQDSNELRKQLAELTAATARAGQENQRAIAKMADDTKRAELERKLAVDAAARPATTTKNAAAEFLRMIGDKGTDQSDEVSALLPKSTGSGIGAAVDWTASQFGGSTAGAQAGDTLRGRAGRAVTSLLGGKLGSGISNADVALMQTTVADIGDTSKPVARRMAAWNDLVRQMRRQAGVEGAAPTAPTAPAGGMVFSTEAEAEAAGLKPGTKVVIGGVSGTWQ